MSLIICVNFINDELNFLELYRKIKMYRYLGIVGYYQMKFENFKSDSGKFIVNCISYFFFSKKENIKT